MGGGVEELVAPPEQEVAEQQRRRLPEPDRAARPAPVAVEGLEATMSRGSTATGVGVVDDVVVNEGGGVEDLERAGGQDYRIQVVGCPARVQWIEGPPILRSPLASPSSRTARGTVCLPAEGRGSSR